MYQIVPQYFVTTSVHVSDQSSRKKTKEVYNPEDDIEYRKRGHLDGDKKKRKTKRTFKNKVVRSNRLDRVGAAKASTVVSAITPTSTSHSNTDCTSIRNIRSSHGSYHHVSLASKLRDKKNKKNRKDNVFASLSLILGSEDDSPIVSDDGIHSASKTKPTYISETDGVDFTTKRKRRTHLHDSPTPKRRDEENNKNRKESVMGSLYSILGPIDGDDFDLSSKSKKIGIDSADDGYFSSSRKRPIIKPTNRNLNFQKDKFSGARTSMLGLEKVSHVASGDSTRLVNGSKSIPTNAARSPRKRRSAIDDFNRTVERKNEQRLISDNSKGMKKTKRRFNEDEARKLIRAKLNKNQRKYDALAAALAAALASTKTKSTSDQTSPSVSTSTRLSESTSNKPKSADSQVKSSVSTLSPKSTSMKPKFSNNQLNSSVSVPALSPEPIPTKAKSTFNQLNSSVSAPALSPEPIPTKAKSTFNQLNSSVSAPALSSEPIPTKAKSTFNQLNSSVSTSPSLLESTEVVMPTIKNILSGQYPKIRSRARNGRLYSVCKRIPPSIPEDAIFEMDSSGNTKKSTSGLSFTLRCSSPRITPKCAVKQQTMSHSTKIETSSRGNDDGGISFSNIGVDKLEQARQMKVRHQRNKRQMFNRWLSDQQ